MRTAPKQKSQQISMSSKSTVQLMSSAEYKKMVKHKLNFVEFMRQSPLVGLAIDLKRDTTSMRDIIDKLSS